MSDIESDTETSQFYIAKTKSLSNNQTNANVNQKTKKKKKHKKNKQVNEKSMDQVPTPKKDIPKIQIKQKQQQANVILQADQLNSPIFIRNPSTKTAPASKIYYQQQPIIYSPMSVAHPHTIIPNSPIIFTPSPSPSPSTSFKLKPDQPCQHMSIYTQLLISIILASICSVMFAKPPKINYPLAQFQTGQHQKVFQIVTDRISRVIKFNLQIDKNLGILPIKSTKIAKVKTTVHYTLGYKFQNAAHSYIPSQHNTKIQMSNLQILSYNITSPILQNKEDGLWNSWQYQDTQKLIKYVQDNFIKKLQKQTLMEINDQKRLMYQNNVKFALNQILQQYQTWFDWLLMRLDRYIDVGLQPYVQNYQIVSQKEKEKKMLQ